MVKKLMALVLQFTMGMFGQTASFPSAIATSGSLYSVDDNVYSTLSIAAGSGDTTLTLADVSRFQQNMIATICEASDVTGKFCTTWEHMLVTGVNSGQKTITVTRGYAGTSPASHPKGKTITVNVNSYNLKVLQNELIAVETLLGVNGNNIPANRGYIASDYVQFVNGLDPIYLNSAIFPTPVSGRQFALASMLDTTGSPGAGDKVALYASVKTGTEVFTTLTADINNSQTINICVADASPWQKASTSSDYFFAQIGTEFIAVSGVTNNCFSGSLLRGVRSSSAQSHNAGDAVYAVADAWPFNVVAYRGTNRSVAGAEIDVNNGFAAQTFTDNSNASGLLVVNGGAYSSHFGVQIYTNNPGTNDWLIPLRILGAGYTGIQVGPADSLHLATTPTSQAATLRQMVNGQDTLLLQGYQNGGSGSALRLIDANNTVNLAQLSTAGHLSLAGATNFSSVSLAIGQDTNGNTGIMLFRNTDSGQSGNMLAINNAANNATLFSVDVNGVVDFRNNTAATAVGGAATLPQNPVGFVKIMLNGTTYKLPYYSN